MGGKLCATATLACQFHRLRHMTEEYPSAGRPGHAEREVAAIFARALQRTETGAAQIVVEHADRRFARSRRAAPQRETPRPARRSPAPPAARARTCRCGSETRRRRRRHRPPPAPRRGAMPRNTASGNCRASAVARRPVADHELGAGQIEREERFEIFFDRQPADRQKNRPRQIEIDACARAEQLGVDAARPQLHVLEAARRSVRQQASASPPAPRRPARESGAARPRSHRAVQRSGTGSRSAR